MKNGVGKKRLALNLKKKSEQKEGAVYVFCGSSVKIKIAT